MKNTIIRDHRAKRIDRHLYIIHIIMHANDTQILITIIYNVTNAKNGP